MIIKSIYHYLIIQKSNLFDRHYYLKKYPDVRKLDIDPLWHFIRHGWKEGRNPSNDFDVDFYLNNNFDVKMSEVNPLIHYIHHGKREGRLRNATLKPVLNYINGSDLEKKYRPNIPVFNEEFLNCGKKPQIEELVSENERISYPNFENLEISDENLEISDENLKDVKIFTERISIIIPTKNAGDDFRFLLKMIRNQKGFNNIEIIIVDSGSQDLTVEISREHNAKVIEIPPEEFSHSYARNLGAKKATGEYLLFMVQDVLPPSDTWLHKMMSELRKLDVSAVSCAELPQEDADLFYRVISWNHYEFLDVNNKDRIFSMPADPNHINMRKNGQLSDLACLIPSDLFNEYQYRFSYAEDLDLGIRLIRDGMKIAFLGSTRIIHSHNRPPFYFLKRGYVDNIFLSDIFSDFKIPDTDFQNIVQDIAFTYNFVCTKIITNISEFKEPINLLLLQNSILKSLNSAHTYKYPKKLNFHQNSYLDTELVDFLNKLLNSSGYYKGRTRYDGRMAKSLIGFVNLTFRYLEQSHDTIPDTIANDLKHCIVKEASILSGANLAFAYISQTEEEKEKYSSIFASLVAGV